MEDTLPGSEYKVNIQGKCENARLFSSRFELLDYIKNMYLMEEPTIVEVGVFHGHFSKHLLDKIKPLEMHLIDTFTANDHISQLFESHDHYEFIKNKFASYKKVSRNFF
jgi:hypothetical protein